MRNEKVLIRMKDNSEIISFNLKKFKGIWNYFIIRWSITDLLVPDKNGNIENVVLKYKDIESYKDNPSYCSAIIGRTAGRIAIGTQS